MKRKVVKWEGLIALVSALGFYTGCGADLQHVKLTSQDQAVVDMAPKPKTCLDEKNFCVSACNNVYALMRPICEQNCQKNYVKCTQDTFGGGSGGGGGHGGGGSGGGGGGGGGGVGGWTDDNSGTKGPPTAQPAFPDPPGIY